jgi:hypothetical protein
VALAQSKAAKSASVQRVSFNPDTATSGFLDDVDVEITDAQTCMFDYQGQQPEQPALCLELTDVNGGEHTQYWTCGKSEDWEPTDDNTGFVAKSGKSGFNKDSNIMHLFSSLLQEGGEAIVNILNAGDCKLFIGLKGHVMTKKLVRPGLKREGPNAQKEPTVLVFSKITALPGTDSKKASAKPAAATKAANKPNGAVAATSDPAAAAADASDIDTRLTADLLVALTENDGKLPKKNLLQIASAAFKGTPQHSKAIARSNAADFLKQFPKEGESESGILFDGAEFSLA